MNSLQPSNTSPTNHQICGLDIETAGSGNRFVLGSVYGHQPSDGSVEVYDSHTEMLTQILSKRFRYGHIYAHNLEFDLMALLQNGGYQYLDDNGYDLEIFHNGANIIHAKIRDGNDHTWEFRDSLNIATHMGVETMGEIIDCPKKDHLIDFEEQDADEIDRGVLEAYNIRDSEIVFKFIKWFKEKINQLGGTLQVTAAKTAMTLFRSQYLNYNIDQPSYDLIQKGYEGYYGGRVSPLVKGYSTGPLYEWDIASLYPYCMKQQPFPNTNSLQFDRGGARHDFNVRLQRIKEYEGMSKVTVEAPEIEIPVLPHKFDEKLLFPTGDFTSWQCHNELRFALQRGYEITEIHEQMYSRNAINPFEEYVDDLFDRRLEFRANDNPTETVVKLMLNSLYGKFGQQIENDDGGVYKRLQDVSIDDLEGAKRINNWVVEPVEYDDMNDVPPYINPIFAAYVTARGRMELYKWIERAKEQGGTVYYCDTDSVWTDIKYDVSNEKNLGSMDFEGEFENLWVFGPKMYIAEKPNGETNGEAKITAKGVPHGEMGHMWNVVKEGGKEIEYNKFAGMREGFRSDDYNPIEEIKRTRKVDITTPTKRVHPDVDHETMLNEQVKTQPVDFDVLKEGVESSSQVEL